MRKLKKPLIITLISVVSIVALVIIFISPITKYLVEKYDVKYLGREVTMNWAYVNPFTGYVHFDDLKVQEEKSDSIFFSAEGISARLDLFKLWKKTYEINKLELTSPRFVIIQQDSSFNFFDIIKRFSPDTTKKDRDTTAGPVHFNLLNIKINDGEVYYIDKKTPINYFIKKFEFESTGVYWDRDSIATKFSFVPGIGKGDMKAEFTINTATLEYRLAAVVNKFNLQIIEQYLKDLSTHGTFRANLDANINAKGNFNDNENIIAKGFFAINDFHFGKTPTVDYASFDKVFVSINELSPKNKKYLFDSISLHSPYFMYEQYDSMDNLETMFGSGGSKIKNVQSTPAKFNLVVEIAKYVKDLAKNFFKSNYKVNRIAIYNGDITYNDYSMGEKFSVQLSPIFVLADSVDKKHKNVKVSLKSGLKPYGNANILLTIDPKDSADFDISYNIQNIPASMFNPYTTAYTSFPLDRGTIGINGNWHVRKGNINSTNHLIIIDPRVTKRVRNKDTRWIPVPLILAFVRERGNVIDYEIPITGNLNNPKFHFRDVIIDLITNIFVKPATSSYRFQVKNIEREIEKSMALKWPIGQSYLSKDQRKFLDKMADFLEDNPEATISVKPNQFEYKEKEYLLLFEAKKKYFLAKNNKSLKTFTDDDSVEVSKLSIKDASFVRYLNTQVKDPLLFTCQDKAARMLGWPFINAKYNRLNKMRQANFLSYFKERGVNKQLKMAGPHNTIPFNGFSFYKIDYNGEIPKALERAYKRMQDFNNEAPRDKYKEKRKK